MKDKKLLKDLYPNLISEINLEKNEKIDIERLRYASGKRLLWKCYLCGEMWQTAIFNRTINRTGCPFCAQKNPRASVKNSLAAMRPELLNFWDYEKNGDLKPQFICYQTHRKVWWKCTNNAEHSYLANVQSRSKGFGGRCPICAEEKKSEKLKAKQKAV